VEQFYGLLPSGTIQRGELLIQVRSRSSVTAMDDGEAVGRTQISSSLN
jgi:hypothetical protein